MTEIFEGLPEIIPPFTRQKPTNTPDLSYTKYRRRQVFDLFCPRLEDPLDISLRPRTRKSLTRRRSDDVRECIRSGKEV